MTPPPCVLDSWRFYSELDRKGPSPSSNQDMLRNQLVYRPEGQRKGQKTLHNYFISVAWSAYIFANRWVAYRLDSATSIFIGACAFLSVVLVAILPDDWPINAGNLGLTLTYSSQLLIWFQWGIRQSAIAENMV